MDDKYKYQYEQFQREQHRQISKWDESDPIPYAPKDWAQKKARKTKYEEALDETKKRYIWTPQLQALEDILWAS